MTYEYDDENRCVKADASVVISTGNSGTKKYSQITEYAYNSAGKKVRTESYIEGEEAANGRNIVRFLRTVRLPYGMHTTALAALSGKITARWAIRGYTVMTATGISFLSGVQRSR